MPVRLSRSPFQNSSTPSDLPMSNPLFNAVGASPLPRTGAPGMTVSKSEMVFSFVLLSGSQYLGMFDRYMPFMSWRATTERMR